MENIPKELEETQLNLQVIIDPETKCLTMRTTNEEEIPENSDKPIPPDILPNDPLQQLYRKDNSQEAADEIDFDNMSEMEKLIYEERVRLLNLKRPKKSSTTNDETVTQHSNDTTENETSSRSSRSSRSRQRQKARIKMRRYRERETSEEREFTRFRQRIITTKIRLLQRLRNFENESYLQEMKKRNTERVIQKRLDRKLKETPEQREQRKRLINYKSRLAFLRRKAFKTPEELLADKERRIRYHKNSLSRLTEEERRAREIAIRQKAKENRIKNKKEWKNVSLIAKGVQPVEVDNVENQNVVKSELMEIL